MNTDRKEHDRGLAEAVGFDPRVVEVIRRLTRKRLDRLEVRSDARTSAPGPGLSLPVADGDESEKLMTAMGAELTQLGCRAFWSERLGASGMKETDEVAIIKAGDRYDPVRIRRTDGANYDISTEDIIDRLRQWEALCRFEVVGASTSWVALTFQALPDKLCAFAEEVYLFCPDAVTQGVGLWREPEHPKEFKAARALCPEISPAVGKGLEAKFADIAVRAEGLPVDLRAMLGPAIEEVETGVRLLAHDLRVRKYVFLWWD